MADLITPAEALEPCVVEYAVITAVYPETYTVDCQGVYSMRELPDVQVAAPLLHHNKGAGLNLMPEVGALCYVFSPADGSSQFILGFVQGSGGESDHSGQRPDLQPGDIALTTQDENFVILRRGGVLQLGSTFMAQRLYIPIENIIRDYFQRYEAFSPLGEIVWDHAELTGKNVDPNTGEVPVIVKFSCREKTQDTNMSVEVRVGKLSEETLESALDQNLLHSGKKTNVTLLTGETAEVETPTLDSVSNDLEHFAGAAHDQSVTGLGFKPYDTQDSSTSVGMLSITVNPQGSAVKYSFQLNKEGSNFIRSEAHMHIECGQTFFVRANTRARIEKSDDEYLQLDKDLKLHVKKALIELLSEGDVKLEGIRINLETKGASIKLTETGVKITGSKIELDSSDVLVGSGGKFSDILTDSKAWKQAIYGHIHMGVTTGAGTSGPAAPTVPGLTKTTITASSAKAS